MANNASNRSSSPFSTRSSRNSELNSSTRRSFSGNPFVLTNPRSLNPPTPANSPATTDLMKRHSIGKENHKDAIRSKNFMAPTISASSKFTPSPRKKILGEKNELARTSIKDSDLKSETTRLDQIKFDEDSATLEKKEVVFETHEVTLDLKKDSSEMLSENSDFICCSPQTSPIIAQLDAADPSLLPYDPKKNFLSPRPQFLRYKPNPRINVLLNKLAGDEDCGDESVVRLEDSFNLSETEEDEDSIESSEKLSEPVSDPEVKKILKPWLFTRSKMISLLSLMFLVVCFSVSFTDSTPVDLSMYKDVGFSEIYDESLKLAKQSFDDFAENVKQWSTDLVSYLSKSCFSSSVHDMSSIQLFNLTIPPPQEEFLFEEIQQLQEEDEIDDEFEIGEVEEEAYQELEFDDEVEMEESNEIQPHEHIESKDDDSLQTNFNLEEASSSDSKTKVESERVTNDVEASSERLNYSISIAGFSMVMMAASVIICYYMMKKRKSGRSRVYKKKPRNNNKRESTASSSDLSYGSFTTLERIAMKKGDEQMLTPIRRSSRLMKNQVIS